MAIPFALSDDFSRLIQSMQDEIRTLRSELNDTRANLGQLTDRNSGTGKLLGLSTFMLPAKVIDGGKFTAQVQFPGNFNPNNWGVDLVGTELEFLTEIEEDETYTVFNILNGFGERDQTGARIFHGLLVEQENGDLVEEQASNSCIPIYFYPGLRGVDAWSGLQEGSTNPAVNLIAGIPVLTYFKPDVSAVCD
jgi:hypothetical protein